MQIFYRGLSSQVNGYGTLDLAFRKMFADHGVEVVETQAETGLALGWPSQVDQINAKRKVLYTMFESDIPPIEWREDIKKFDLVILPNEWNATNFAKRYGVKTEVIPLGYDRSVFKPMQKHKTDKPFVFFMYEAFNIRKGFDIVVSAFQKAFDLDPDYQLILKTQRLDINTGIYRMIPNIKVIQKDWSPDRLNAFFTEVDCFVFPSRGEGYGMTPLEALAAGKPTIISDIPPFQEQYKDLPFMVIKSAGTSAPAYEFKHKETLGNWIETDVDALADKMKWIAKNLHVQEHFMIASNYMGTLDRFDLHKNIAKILNFL